MRITHNGTDMRMYVGVTDSDWFNILRNENCDEVNFWRPGSSSFKALSENEMFLFKLHSPQDYIVGGGFFVKYSLIPTYLAWEAFGIKNGTRSLRELNDRINKYRLSNNMVQNNPQIGCIILTEPFYFDEENWIPVPADWKKSIVQGKTYSTDTEIGKRLYRDVQDRLNGYSSILREEPQGIAARYAESITKHRLGQGAFRVAVADAYQRRCAITGEKTLPVLQAAHIKPYSQEGPHQVSNGLLLKSDFHTLYDDGYITVDTDYRVNVSRRLHEDYGNGKDYYKYDGQKLLILPENSLELPSKQFLEWHNEHVYLG